MNLVIALLLSILAPAASDAPQQKYISKYSQVAVSEMHRTGVPASITLAQGIIESNSGRSDLAVKGNNHFGIKCHNDWKGKKIYKDAEIRGECFRAYKTVEESFRDHSDFLRYRDRYKALFDLSPTDYKAWAQGLKKAGYATDPNYPAKLIRVIEEWKLYRFDKDRSKNGAVTVPEPPEQMEKVERADAATANENVVFNLSREVFKVNGVRFIVAEEGDTFAAIASQMRLFPSELLRYNDASADTDLKAGDRVYLGKKKNRAAKGLDKYVVEADCESLRDISQRFAVRLSSLMKMNAMSDSKPLAEGDIIRLR